jgi:hypothetical protein
LLGKKRLHKVIIVIQQIDASSLFPVGGVTCR